MTNGRLISFLTEERDRFVNYVRSILHESDEIEPEDVVHDVMVKLVERADATTPEALAAYVFRALRNRIVDHGRTRRATVPFDPASADGGLDLPDGAPSPIETLQSREGRQALFRALDQLSDVERDVLIAHEFEGIPFKALAAERGMPIGTLLSHKSRALKKLKKLIHR